MKLGTMARNLWSDFEGLGEFEEVIAALVAHTGGDNSGVPGRRNASRFGRNPQFEARYSNRGNPILEATPEISAQALNALIERCRELLAPVPRWFTTALEVDASVGGSFADAEFVLRPVPDMENWLLPLQSLPEAAGAPLVYTRLPNVFLLDVLYLGSGGFNVIDWMRRDRAVREMESLIMIGVWPMARPSRRYHAPSFVTIWDPANHELRGARLSRGLAHPSLRRGAHAAGETPNMPALRMVSHENFVSGPIPDADPVQLVVHEQLGEMVRSARSLPTSERKALARALHWLEVATTTNIATVQVVAAACAIEALVPSAAAEPCTMCGQDRLRVTARFNEFVQRHAADENARDLSDFLYPARSRLVHGTHQYEIDDHPMGILGEGWIETSASIHIARKSILNWLWQRTTGLTR